MNNSNGVRNKQNRLLISLVAVGCVGLCALGYYLVRDEMFPPSQIKTTVLPLDKSNPQELWMTRLESEKVISDQKVHFLEDAALINAKREEEREKESKILKEEVAKLKEGLRAVAAAAAATSTQTRELREPRDVAVNDPFSPQNATQKASGSEPISSIAPVKITFSEIVVDKPGKPEKMHHVDTVIPAGTSVKAVLVSSVDMPCGVNTATDPQPVKLRLIDDGRLPKKVRSKLKGSIIIGSAYGDLSNERIYMRIERLTQVRADGNFIETAVVGYITGEDGKYGVKGCVVDKSYKMVENAALSGLFNGISQYLQATATRGFSISDQACTFNARDLTANGVCGGANGAFDVLTNYYIKRAEQIRPVIKASAGRIVDVTFIHNAELGDLHVQDRVRQIRECSRREEDVRAT